MWISILPTGADMMKSESEVQQQIRLDASEDGIRLWRNNVGVARDEHNRPVRYGLLNESKVINDKFKSSDLIGITPVVITQEMVGMTLGVFTAVECKRQGWRYTGSPKEKAQNNFIELVRSLGGIANFKTEW